MTNPTVPFSVITFFGQTPGPRLLVLGAVHGNEPCGPLAIQRMIDAITRGHVRIKAGSVTFVPVTNPKAYAQNTREGDRNLNRNLTHYATPEDFEDTIANALIPVMEQCDVLLDIHSFKTHGRPFVFVGPDDNSGPLQPFQHAAAELRFAQALGIDTMVYGWLDAYDQYVTDQNAFLDRHPHVTASRSRRDLGIGTTECFRRLGKYGVTIECGNHTDPDAAPVAYRAIEGALACLGLSNDVTDHSKPFTASYKFTRILLRENAGDRFARPWALFDSVNRDDVMATRETGDAVRAPADGAVIFAYENDPIGEGWMYFAEKSARGTS